MALASYTDLLASVASWINRTDLTAVIPDFVTIAESRISRDLRVRKQLVVSTLTTSTTTRLITLPADWLEFDNVSLAGTPETPMQFVTIEHMDVNYPEAGTSGRPFVYTVEGDSMYVGPQPNAVYKVNIIYYARFPSLAVAPNTNWLMTNHPMVYLYACLREAALFTMNDERAMHWDALYLSSIKDLMNQDDRATHSGTVLRVKKV